MTKIRPRKSQIYWQRRKTLLKCAPRKCPLCNRPMWSPRWGQSGGAHIAEATVDHIHPLAKGGTDDMDNLRVICRSCNQAKGDAT